MRFKYYKIMLIGFGLILNACTKDTQDNDINPFILQMKKM